MQDVEEPNSDEEKRSAIELDLLNVLPDELDPKVTYRQAVRLSSLSFLSRLSGTDDDCRGYSARS